MLDSAALYLCGDIGGTNSRLQLWATNDKVAPNGTPVAEEVLLGEQTYPSTQFPTLEAVISTFLGKYNPRLLPVRCMCLAVAGPVDEEANSAQITNLPWEINGAALARAFGVPSVRLLNDFAGIGYGLLALQPSDLKLVHAPVGPNGAPVVPPITGVKAVIGAGTGLGECFLTHSGQHYDVWPAEGGHTDFAPRDETEFEIMRHIMKNEKIGRVSVERVVSGLGLPNLYDFLVSRAAPGQANPEVRKQIQTKADDVGKIIAENAKSGKCPICVSTMDLFMQLYGAEAGNLSLKTLPLGGLYIAGGIAGKNVHALLKNDQFVRGFLAKGRMRPLLARVPIYLITHPQVGLLGAQVICRRLMQQQTLLRAKL